MITTFVEGVNGNCTEIIPLFWFQGPNETCSQGWKSCKCSPGDLAVPMQPQPGKGCLLAVALGTGGTFLTVTPFLTVF